MGTFLKILSGRDKDGIPWHAQLIESANEKKTSSWRNKNQRQIQPWKRQRTVSTCKTTDVLISAK